MVKYIFFVILASLAYSCQEKEQRSNTKDLEKIADLESEITVLKDQTSEKEILVQESLRFFNEIQQNLEQLDIKQKDVREKSNAEEVSEEDKKWILDQIKAIQTIREANTKKINSLSIKLKNSVHQVKELQLMLDRLVRELQAKDEQIAELESELHQMSQDYARVFDEYQVQTELVSDLEEELKTAYYCYGSEKELRENKVIEVKNGVIGIGKKVAIADGMNTNYFEKLNVFKKKEIIIEAEKVRLVTDHPSSSYQLIPVGKTLKLKITDPAEFWKVSKYLIILVK